MGSQDYSVSGHFNGRPSAVIAAYQLPGSNALKTADYIREKMEKLKDGFPEGVEYRIYYDTTVFINESIAGVVHTLIEAFVLVSLVVYLFLRDVRATDRAEMACAAYASYFRKTVRFAGTVSRPRC